LGKRGKVRETLEKMQISDIGKQLMVDQVMLEALDDLRKTLRKGQQAMADWQGGELAVSAVPRAGKSTGMAIAQI
jgi:hypothetical protein